MWKYLRILVLTVIAMLGLCCLAVDAKDVFYKQKRISQAQYNRITSKQALQEQRRQESVVQSATKKICSCGCGKVGCECSKQSE